MRNPGTEIPQFPERKRRRYVTPAEMPSLAAAIDDDPNEFAGHAFWLLLLTGIRRNEVLGAKWADIDWDNRTLFIGKTKNGEPVLRPLSRAAIARLKTIPQLPDNPYIICGAIPGQPLAYLDAMWRRIRKETGFHDLRIHDLRRTVGSWLVRDGASLHLVGAVLNHKDQKTTAGYAYFQTEDRQRVLDRHGRNIVEIAKGIKRRRGQRKASPGIPPIEKPVKLPRVRRISRKELYDLVWAEPMNKLAERFGISDVGLGKVCRRAGIPVPARRFWAKLAAKGPLERPALPIQSNPKYGNLTLRINRSDTSGGVAQRPLGTPFPGDREAFNSACDTPPTPSEPAYIVNPPVA